MSPRALALASMFAVGLGLAPAASAQMNPRGEAKVTLAGKPVVVEYGRPSLKGRDMLGQARVGDEWRMGADSATTLKTPVTLRFGTVEIAPGEYVLKAKKVSEKEWALKLESEGKAALEVPLQASSLEKSVEDFTIALSEEKGQGVFSMSWGTLALSARFSAK